MTQFVRIERSSNGVATVRIDRPKVNAMSFQLMVELIEAAGRLAVDRSVRAVVIWGGPEIFSAGIDVGDFTEEEFASFDDLVDRVSNWIAPIDAEGSFSEHGIPSFGDLVRKFNNWITVIDRLPQITVSAVNGAALATGLELALATDFRVAAQDATFGQPEIKLGIMPGSGASHFLPRLVGLTKAREMIYSGDPVDAAEALRVGLVSRVCPPEETYDAALEMAARYAAGPAALQFAKQALRTGTELPLEQTCVRETDYIGGSLATDDAAIGVSTFPNKDPGTTAFTGR